jgi:hypothetical protein
VIDVQAPTGLAWDLPFKRLQYYQGTITPQVRSTSLRVARMQDRVTLNICDEIEMCKD